MLESYRDLTDEQLIAALKNSGDPDGKIMDYLLFTCFFAKLYAGPIVQYSQLREQWLSVIHI